MNQWIANALQPQSWREWVFGSVQILAPKSQTLISLQLCSGLFIMINIDLNLKSNVLHNIQFPGYRFYDGNGSLNAAGLGWWGKEGFDTQAKTDAPGKVIAIPCLKLTVMHQIPWVCFWKLLSQWGRSKLGVFRRQLLLPGSVTWLCLVFWVLVLWSEEMAGMLSCRSKRVSLSSPRSILGT